MFRIDFIFKLIQSHYQSVYCSFFILKTFISFYFLVCWISPSGKLLKKFSWLLYIWITFLGYIFLLNLCTVFSYLPAFNFPAATPHLFPSEDDSILSLPRLPALFAWPRGVFLFKFKNLTGFVLKLSVYFQNSLEHSLLFLICKFSCFSISKKFSYPLDASSISFMQFYINTLSFHCIILYSISISFIALLFVCSFPRCH